MSDERTGDGKTELTIGAENGRVIVWFPKSLSWFAMDPENAARIGKAMIDEAVGCGANVTLMLPERQMTPQQEMVLLNRMALVLRDLSERGRETNYIVRELLGIVRRQL